MKQSVILSIFFGLLFSSASAVYPMGKNETGTATFYGAVGNQGTCSLDLMEVDYITTAMSSSQWFNADICGACLQIYGPHGKTTKVMVTNMCPNCGKNHLDLDPKAFAKLAPTKQGVINPIKWKIIPCNHKKRPIEYHFKDGASQWWFALQVLYHNIPIIKMEVSTNGGKTWTNVPRQSYNYFVYNSGFGPGPYSVRITGENGKKIVDTGIMPGDNTVIKGKKNF